ncbi:5'-methylthioadenosine/S-adenosylhomocysteine nucleosidase [Arthrobacter gengyunqii]|uniref:adenosylhomocysteine nucleosidase n=1 Tax=Arthrobacter gengyunqii TaxID=2886940 RepID=A0A9X1S6D5_9MICC|nr:5'-methylthioadenosine/S-adenosylhomocysteine nucleosidase [Arthrobacter gengyunqii]MCC3270445.1 5'-methylthioadenosine/S-adenosylhomocysteine nucleosidase [Arthrobacter gengyunqii]UOY97632.1 5'-methylthioadenosine/S-adenosylhomocysteine nucleosidase [Arthrobacter gengyunqii]
MSSAAFVILVAMEDELAPFLERAEDVGPARQIGNAIHRDAVLAGHPVVLVRTGIGLVNAAGAATSAILEAQRAGGNNDRPVVISAGSAGGLGAGVRVGDVVVGSHYINVDADARAFGYKLGQVPGMPEIYPAPESLTESIRLAQSGGTIPMHHGLIVSSYNFVTPARAELITGSFPGALATDMESSAIAQTCFVFGVPFISVRGISDLCGPAAEDDFRDQVDDAATQSANVVTSSLDALAGVAGAYQPA